MERHWRGVLCCIALGATAASAQAAGGDAFAAAGTIEVSPATGVAWPSFFCLDKDVLFQHLCNERAGPNEEARIVINNDGGTHRLVFPDALLREGFGQPQRSDLPIAITRVTGVTDPTPCGTWSWRYEIASAALTSANTLLLGDRLQPNGAFKSNLTIDGQLVFWLPPGAETPANYPPPPLPYRLELTYTGTYALSPNVGPLAAAGYSNLFLFAVPGSPGLVCPAPSCASTGGECGGSGLGGQLCLQPSTRSLLVANGQSSCTVAVDPLR